MGSQKRKTADFGKKCTSLEESLPQSWLSCRPFIGLTIRAKMIGGGDHIYLKFWVKVTALERHRRLPIYFRS